MKLQDEPKTEISTEFVVKKSDKSFSIGRAASHGARRVAIVATNGDFGEVAHYRDYYHGEYQSGFASIEAAQKFFAASKNGQRMTLGDLKELIPAQVDYLISLAKES